MTSPIGASSMWGKKTTRFYDLVRSEVLSNDDDKGQRKVILWNWIEVGSSGVCNCIIQRDQST